METTTTQGGKRSNAGRKPSQDPKQSIFVFIKGSIIEKLGGKKEVKAALEKFAETL